MKNLDMQRVGGGASRRSVLLKQLAVAAVALPALAASVSAYAQTVGGVDRTVARPQTGSKVTQFRITRTGSTSAPLSVNYQTQDGTAIAGVDYTAVSGTAVFGVGQSSVFVDVPILASATATGNVGFVLRVGVNQAGNTNLQPQQLFSTRIGNDGAGPTSVSVADINSDGRAEVIITNSRLNNVAGLFNTTPTGGSSASFNPPQTIVTGSNPTSSALADFNRDNLPDGVVANRGSNTIRVYSNSTGPAIPTVDLPTPAGPNFVVTGLFVGGSNFPDIAVASDAGQVTIFQNVSGTFSAASTFTINLPAGAAPVSMAVGDVNGDGRSDIVVANRGLNSVSVALNAGGGSFNVTTIPVGTGPTSVDLTDLDGDGLPDLSVAEANDNRVSVFRNTTPASSTTPSFAAPLSIAAGEFPLAVKAADINGDGRPDLLAANGGGDSLALLSNTSTTGSLSFGQVQLFPASANPDAIAVGDINNDGRPDVVVANFTPSTVSVYVNGGNLTFTNINGTITPARTTPQ